MKDTIRQLRNMLMGFVLGLYITTPAVAEDIEIYTVANLSASTVQPNIVFIMDSSSGMLATLPAANQYDHRVTYDLAGGYDPTKVYFSTDGSVPLTNGAFFDWAANKCDHSLKEYDSNGLVYREYDVNGDLVYRDAGGNVVAAGTPDATTIVSAGTAGAATLGPLYTVGLYAGQIAQYYAQPAKKIWRSLSTQNATTQAYPIECIQDAGIHGATDAANKKFIANKKDDSSGWATTDPGVGDILWANSGNNYTMFAGNYLNYLVDPAVVTSNVSLFDQLKNAIEILVASASNVNIGLARYDGGNNIVSGINVGGEGGPMRYPALDVNLGRQDFYQRLSTMNAGGDPVIAETYYEVLQYFGGKEIVYGNSTNPSNSTGVKEQGNPTNYETPITETCQKNYIVAVSNGLSRYDFLDETRRASLPGFDTAQCNSDAFDDAFPITNKDAFNSEASTIDNCLDEMAEWAFSQDYDVAERAFPAHDGGQHIRTYTVGFAFPSVASQELLDGEQLLRDTARRGGGRFLQADNQDELVAVLSELLAEILKVNSTFSSPAVSVNAFNRSTNLDDLYFTLFKPALGEHWEGNFKKFKLLFDANRTPFIADQNNAPAIDANTGFFKDTSSSYWTLTADAPDGPETAKGGAASHLQAPPARKVYTMMGTYSNNNGVLTPSAGNLTAAGNELAKTNAAINEGILGIVGLPPEIGVIPYRESLLDWAAGIDVLDSDVDGSVTDARRMMGDPLHAEPALVQYGLTASDEPDLVSYVATNDGYLHSVNTLDGSEYWAFVPREMLGKLDNIFVDSGVNGKQYGLDGNVVPWINDANGDGTISGAGEHAYIYFGMRRGGDKIYSMDVTNRNSPVLRWVIDGGVGDYTDLGQTWSPPNVEKIKMGGTARTVLIYGGGYDVTQDVADTRTTDSVGTSIFITDADTGALLWRVGPDAQADLRLTEMQYSIPARIKPLDVNGDGYVDRLYVGDMGGQLFRIDIDNEASTASSIAATGGRIANLAVNNDVNETRRFYYPPDVALIVQDGHAPYLSIVAASGFRAHPLNTDVHDRFYMIRDYDVYNVPTTYTTLTEADLFDTTSNVIAEGTVAQKATAVTALGSAKGWFISLNQPDGTYIGEKSLAEPLILNGTAIITTYLPASAGISSDSCTPNDGTGSLFFVDVTDGTPTYDLSGDDTKTREDRQVYLDRGGIPPSPTIIITEGGTPTLCVGTECERAGDIGAVQKMYWYEVEE